MVATPEAQILPFLLGPLFLLGCEYAQRPRGLDQIYVRPGVGAFGVGLIAIRPIPPGGVICSCSAQFSDQLPGRRLNLLRPSVRQTVLELYDGWDGQGLYQAPSQYDQAIPLISCPLARCARLWPGWPFAEPQRTCGVWRTVINHNEEPNCIYDEETNCIVAARKVRTGEECTVDYLSYQQPGSYTWRACTSGFKRRPWFV
jgi:hypothetical protein